jgi:hypothetical protein
MPGILWLCLGVFGSPKNHRLGCHELGCGPGDMVQSWGLGKAWHICVNSATRLSETSGHHLLRDSHQLWSASWDLVLCVDYMWSLLEKVGRKEFSQFIFIALKFIYIYQVCTHH